MPAECFHRSCWFLPKRSVSSVPSTASMTIDKACAEPHFPRPAVVTCRRSSTGCKETLPLRMDSAVATWQGSWAIRTGLASTTSVHSGPVGLAPSTQPTPDTRPPVMALATTSRLRTLPSASVSLNEGTESGNDDCGAAAPLALLAAPPPAVRLNAAAAPLATSNRPIGASSAAPRPSSLRLGWTKKAGSPPPAKPPGI